MSVWLDQNSLVLVQGMTGSEGRKHTQRMIGDGTRIVGGVTPGKGGQTVVFEEDPVPVFDSVAEAKRATGANTSVVFVPAAHTKQAVLDAIDAQLDLVVVITEGVPVADTAHFVAYARRQGHTRVIGPNCPGLISPGKSNAGIIPPRIAGPGPIGLISKSGTLTYQMMFELRDLGFSSAVGVGGDPVNGTSHIDGLAAYEADPETRAIMLIGEIGGDAEERAAAYIAEHVTKPVVAYVAGFTAPVGRTMGHAGAIITGSAGTAAAKKAAFEAAGVHVGHTPSDAAALMRAVIAELA